MLDLDHLSRQTLGNRVLEREVLELFVRQAAEQVERLRTSADGRERREAAHAILGSARAVGASELARLAGAVEGSEGSAEAEIAALAEVFAATRAFILAQLAK